MPRPARRAGRTARGRLPVMGTDYPELARHARAGIELRVTPSIWPFWRRVTASTVAFSGSRLHNAAPHPDLSG
jgi:uncharacterized protein DUF6886